VYWDTEGISGQNEMIDKPSPMGLGTLRNGGRAKRPIRESDIMKNTGEIRNVHVVNAVVSGAKTPNQNGIREFGSEFRRNLQPSHVERASSNTSH
jgi:hypothetical protein